LVFALRATQSTVERTDYYPLRGDFIILNFCAVCRTNGHVMVVGLKNTDRPNSIFMTCFPRTDSMITDACHSLYRIRFSDETMAKIAFWDQDGKMELYGLLTQLSASLSLMEEAFNEERSIFSLFGTEPLMSYRCSVLYAVLRHHDRQFDLEQLQQHNPGDVPVSNVTLTLMMNTLSIFSYLALRSPKWKRLLELHGLRSTFNWLPQENVFFPWWMANSGKGWEAKTSKPRSYFRGKFTKWDDVVKDFDPFVSMYLQATESIIVPAVFVDTLVLKRRLKLLQLAVVVLVAVLIILLWVAQLVPMGVGLSLAWLFSYSLFVY